MMLSNFPQIVKYLLAFLPQDDYPKLDTFSVVSCWLSFVLDQSQTGMRCLFKRLNIREIDIDISTFSKASKNRDPVIFYNLFVNLKKRLIKEKKIDKHKLLLFPLDSTIVTLTSKLMWNQGYGQVKLFSGINICTNEPDGILINFGSGHDSKYGEETIAAIPENGVGVMDRGFAKSVFEKFLVVKKVQKSPQRYSLSIYKKQRQPHGSNQQIIPHRLNQ